MSKDKKKKKKIIDLRRFMEPEISSFDPDGSYTGVTDSALYDADTNEPVQDADDL